MWLAFRHELTGYSAALLRRLFQNMECIESLDLETCVTGFVELLRPQQNEETLFSDLEKLAFHSVLIADDPEIRSCYNLKPEALLRCLSERKANNDDILELEFDSDCQILVSDIDQLRDRFEDLVLELNGI